MDHLPAPARYDGRMPHRRCGRRRLQLPAISLAFSPLRQTLAQMAISWTLRDPRMTSALIGASSVEQLEDSVAAVDRLDFSAAELDAIDEHAVDAGINIWAESSAA